MKTLEQLLAQWEEGTLSAADTAELKQRLADPQSRKALVEDWMFYEAIYGALQAQSSLQQQAVATSSRTPVAVPSRSLGERVGSWLAPLARPSWRWAVGGAVAAAVGLTVYFMIPGEPVARFTALQGKVMVEHGGKSIPATPALPLYSGDTLQVAAGGGALVAWPEEQTLVKLWPGSRFQLQQRRGVKQLDLTQGQMLAVVARQPTGKPMIIRTPQAEVMVKGTRFTLAVTEQATRLDVLAGAVAMRPNNPGGTSQLVTPGNFALAMRNQPLKVASVTGRATRELIARPSGTQPTTAGQVVWSETVDRLDVRGWPLGISPAANTAYQQRLRGFLTVPIAGEYSFWISSAYPAEFWLSPDGQPANRRLLIAVTEESRITSGQSPDANRRSAPQKLPAGKRLYFEALHQIGPGEAVAVGWVRPGAPTAGSLIEIINGDVISPWIETQ